jgi:hypothetical protein
MAKPTPRTTGGCAGWPTGQGPVICCARLGEHARDQDHHESISLIESVDKSAAKHLAVLLDMKTSAGYSSIRSSGTDRRRAKRATQALIDTAETIGRY